MGTVRVRAALPAALAVVLLATSACTGAESQDDSQSTSTVSSTPSESVSESVAPAVATTEETFEFSDGTTVGVLSEPWAVTDRVDGELLHMIPGQPGTSFDDEVWGDIIVYVPDAAHGPGATAPEPMPADPVAWTTSHADLEILDEREITVDGVTATQIDARAVKETNWLTVGAFTFEWGGAERVVLISLDESWLVVRGSAFNEDVAFAESPAAGDPFAAVLESLDLAG